MSTVAKTGRSMQICASRFIQPSLTFHDRAEVDLHAGKEARREMAVGVGELGLYGDGASGGIDDSADHAHLAGERLPGVGIDRGPHGLAPLDPGKVALRELE